jgi:hypothetical protein
MSVDALTLLDPPVLENATLLLALTGWMDGGQVSTGTVRHLMGRRPVREIARIEPDDFYLYNMPGDMSTAALFRPEVKYEQGIVTQFEFPHNTFACDVAANLVFFAGKEPNLRWQAFNNCFFSLADHVGIKRIVFIGSFGGAVPHTREPRLYGSVSHPRMKDELRGYGVRLSDYEGPAGFSTLLLAEAPRHDIEMLSLVAEIPGYLEGLNPMSIETITRRLGRMLNVPVDLDRLRETSNEWEAQVTAAVEKDADLAETIRKLEADYDSQLIQQE